MASSRRSAFASGRGRPRISAHLGPDSIRLELPLARDRELDQHGADGAEERQRELGGGMGVLVVAPTAEHQQVGQVRYRTRNGRRDGRGQHVAVLHVRQLVRQHPLELLLGHVLENAGRHGDDGVLGIPPGGERVGLLVRRHRDHGHGESGALTQPVDHGVQLRRLLWSYDLRSVHPQDHFVREEVHPEVQEGSEDQRDHQALRPTQQLAGQ
jgi:hypothetical protein